MIQERPASHVLSVVHVVRSDSFSGVERYICEVANGLAERGHQVMTVGGDPARMRAELSEGVENRPAASVGRAARALAALGPVDIVHAHMTAAEAAAWLAHPLQRSPIVATRHFADDRGSSPLARALARVTSRVVSRDIAISGFVAGSISGPSVLLHSGVPIRDQAPLDGHDVLMLQRISIEKATDVGLRAWAESGLGTAGWRLVVAGTGDQLDTAMQSASALGVADSVVFAGHVVDTGRLLTRTSILLAPAPAEPFGLSVVEAMAHGIPVVAAGAGAHLETVGDAGMLFAPGSASDAAKALKALAGDQDLRRRMGADLRRRQQELFTVDRHLDGLEAIYAEVTGSGVAVTW
jgi:glycosyltransferase involved in cell wall biosynthesis